MILTALGTIYVVLLSLALGVVLACAAERMLPGRDQQPPAVALVVLAGLAVASSLLTLMSLVHSLSLVAHALLIGVTVVALAATRRSVADLMHTYWKQRERLHPLVLAIAGIAVALLLMRSSGPPHHYDVGFYYAQAERWLREYGSVPGLGNLHHPLANNSSWHVLQAVFDFSAIAGGPIPALNACVVAVGELTALAALNRLLTKPGAPSTVLGALLVVPITVYFEADFSSPITDISTAMIGCIVFFLLLRRTDRGAFFAPDREAILIAVVCAFAATVKLSMAPLAVFAAMAALMSLRRSPRHSTLLILGMAIPIVPWLARGIVLSGYPVFPLPGLPPLPVDWAMPAAKVAEAAQAIQAWSRMPQRSLDEVASLPITDWLPQWWSRIDPLMRLTIAVAAIAPPLTFVVGAVLARSSRGRAPGLAHWLLLMLLWYTGVWLWFLGAPQPRYGLGFILPIGLVVLAVPLYFLVRVLGTVGPVALAAGMLIFQGAGVATAATKTDWSGRWLTPAPYVVPITRTAVINDYPLRLPIQGDQCWDTPLPCAPRETPSVVLRGCGLDQGFRTQDPPSKEHREQCPSIASELNEPPPVGAPPVWIANVQVYRRNPNEVTKIACLADRRNVLRVVVRNHSSAVAGPLDVDATIDGSTRVRGTLAPVGRLQEQHLQMDIPVTLRAGTHRVEVRLTSSPDSSQVFHRAEAEFVCQPD